MTEREIAEVLAYRVMGWDEPSRAVTLRLWNPARNIADAWAVVEKMREKGLNIRIENNELGYVVGVREEGRATWIVCMEAKTAQEAICMAALRAWGWMWDDPSHT